MPQITSERLATGLLFIAVVVLACLAPAQSDTWWLLRAGRDIVRDRGVALIDSYSFTAAGDYWPNHEWLTEVSFYGLFKLGGLGLVTSFCAAAALLAWSLAWSLLPAEFEGKFLAFAAAVLPSAFTWSIRPQMLTTTAFVATAALLVRHRLKWIPWLFLLWANLHGAVAVGLVEVTAATVAVTIQRRRIAWDFVATSIGCAVATLCTPLGYHLWTFVPASVARLRSLGVVEWQSPGLQPSFIPFWVLATFLPVAAVVKRRHLKGPVFLATAIALSVLPLALSSLRSVPLFMLLGSSVIASLCMPERSGRPAAGRGERVRLNAFILCGVAAAASVGIAIAWREPSARLDWRPLSSDALQAVSACPEPMYNTFGDGGVFLWFTPDRKVFIDNRQDPYSTDFLTMARSVEANGRYRPLFARYGIRCAVVSPGTAVAVELSRDSTWIQLYSDERWQIYAPR